ncbi:hypothetical protein HNY73_011961 [Argiope bruennichi]|uniref:Uncharacterized protein n=1 Tax=Argiope bruennichi TaxID=94029 RepID=A0A8T0EY76_ARGBR|nr:hypothetical protein HNY73_011961 [Argiope bruennichi]
MIRAKGFCLFVLAALILPQCNIGLNQRTITAPCAQEVGPAFRCISPKNCGPNLMQNLTEIVICGPNGIGICCPVISFHSQAGCGIRVRSIAAPSQDTRYPNVPDAAYQVAFTSFTQSMHGQRMLTQGDILVDSLGIINRNPSNASGEMNENSTLEEHGIDEELLTPSDSVREIHYEVPLVHVSPQDTRRRKSASVEERRFNNLLMDRKPQIVWSFPQNVSKWNKQTSYGPDSFHNVMEEYMNMAKEIEKLILQVGGMDTICREYPELAQILTVELNKNCPPAQSSIITSYADWKFTGEEGESSFLKDQRTTFEAKGSSNLVRNRREAKDDEKDWEQLYYLSREYLRKLLLMMVSEKPGEPLSYENIAKLPLYPPFSPRQLRAIIVRDPTIIDRSAALEITKGSRMTYSKDSITNTAIESSQSLYDSSFKNNPIRSSIKNNVSEVIEGSVSQAAVQHESESEVKGTVDEKILDGSKIWDLRLEMTPTNNKKEASEYLNSDIHTIHNSKQVWRTGNRKNIPLESIKVVTGEERHEVILSNDDQGSKSMIQNQEIDENEEENGSPLHVFHVKVDHKTDYSKMLKTDEAVDFEKGRTLKDLVDFRVSKNKNFKTGEHSKAGLKGEEKLAGNENHSMRMRAKTVENKNDRIQLRADGKLRQEFLQSPEMAKDTTEAWAHIREEGDSNEKEVIAGSAVEIERSSQNRGKILFHQASEHRDLSSGKEFPDTIVESYKLMKANIPHTSDGTDFKINKENRSDVDFMFNLKGRSAKEKGVSKIRFRSNVGEEDILQTAIIPDTNSELLLSNTASPSTIHTSESAELLFNIRNDSAANNGNINFGQSVMLENNNAGQFKVGNSEENKEVRETVFKPTNSQQITEETKTRFSDGTTFIMHDSSQSKDLKDISVGKITNQTFDSENVKDVMEFAKKNSESNASEIEFNRKTHEGSMAGKFKLSMEHSLHADGENNKNGNYEPSVLFSVESQHDLHATEKSLLNHQTDESQKSIFETGSLTESKNNHAGMGFEIHTDDKSRLDGKLSESSSHFHNSHKIEEEISIPGHQNNPLDLSSALNTDLLAKASIELTTEDSNIRNSFGLLNMEALSGVLMQSESKAASELEHLAKHFTGETILDSNLSVHSNKSSDTGVHLNPGATEAEKNATLFIVEKESNPSKVSMEGGSIIHEMGMEAKDILSNVKDSFNAGPELKLSNQKKSNVNSDSESISPVVVAFNDSQKVAISKDLKKGINFNTGSRNFRLGIRVKRDLGEPELSYPYHISFHDNEPLTQPQPFENQINQYNQPTTTTTLVKWNTSSDNNSNMIQQAITKNNSNLSDQTELKLKTSEKSSASRGMVNLKHKKNNFLTNLVTTSGFPKDTKRKHSKGAVNKIHRKKKGKRYNNHHKNSVIKSIKLKNNSPSHNKTKQKKSGNERNKHQIPSKNTNRRHHKEKETKHKTNHKGKQMKHKTSHKGKQINHKTNPKEDPPKRKEPKDIIKKFPNGYYPKKIRKSSTRIPG